MNGTIRSCVFLALAAIGGSLLTALIMHATAEPQVVHAAPTSDVLPPLFKKDMVVAYGENSAGKVVSTYGTWVEFASIQQGSTFHWWINTDNPKTEFSEYNVK